MSDPTIPLWIMAVVSVLEALLLIGLGIGGYVVYARVTRLVNDLETRQIAPLRAKLDTILADVHTVTSRVAERTERVDDAAARVSAGVHDKVNQAVGVVRGIRAVIMSLLRTESHA